MYFYRRKRLIEFVCKEDAEASWFIKRILGPKLTPHLKFCDATFSGDFLATIAQKNIPEFNNSIIILDGDKSIANNSANVLKLPGEQNPENVFRNLMQKLPPDNTFWSNEVYYTKQVFEHDLLKLTNGCYDDRVKMKKWFNDQKKYWGHGAIRIYKLWQEQNSDQANEFKTHFIRVYNNIAKRKSIPTLS